MIRKSSPISVVNTKEDGNFSYLIPGWRQPEGGCTRFVATTRIEAKKLGERQRESANSIPVPVGKKNLDAAGRTDSAATSDQMGQYGDERGAQSVSLSERRPGKEKEKEEEDDDVDAMKVMNRCRGTASQQPILFWDWMKFYPQYTSNMFCSIWLQ